jgi:AcrR family transcriptional regulator
MTPRTHDAAHFASTREQILATARAQMHTYGTLGLSMRAVARELDLSAAALYRYYDSLDALITALIVRAFDALADALIAVEGYAAHLSAYQAALAASDADPQVAIVRLAPAQRVPGAAQVLRAVLCACRGWALANQTDFELIFGNPIPGYVAPREITVPAATRSIAAVCSGVVFALANGELTPRPPFQAAPPASVAYLQALIAANAYPITPAALYLGFTAWEYVHGFINLELHGHLGPIVGDLDAYFHAQIDRLLLVLGVHAEALAASAASPPHITS